MNEHGYSDQARLEGVLFSRAGCTGGEAAGSTRGFLKWPRINISHARATWTCSTFYITSCSNTEIRQNGRSRCTDQCRTCKERRNSDARNNPNSSERGLAHVRRSLTIMHILEDGSRTDNRIGSAEFTLPPKTKGPPAHCEHAACLNLKSNRISFANQYRA